MQRKIYDAQRMATCQGLPRLMKKLGLLQKHKKTKIKVKKKKTDFLRKQNQI